MPVFCMGGVEIRRGEGSGRVRDGIAEEELVGYSMSTTL